MLTFTLPTEKNRDDVISFYKEIKERDGKCICIGNYEDYNLWLKGMRNRHAGKLGLEQVLCICDEDNYASEKVILKNGGVFENNLYDSEENVNVKRFWIKI